MLRKLIWSQMWGKFHAQIYSFLIFIQRIIKIIWWELIIKIGQNILILITSEHIFGIIWLIWHNSSLFAELYFDILSILIGNIFNWPGQLLLIIKSGPNAAIFLYTDFQIFFKVHLYIQKNINIVKDKNKL